ncbi:MAG: hypothetical protein WC254_00075 [Candidatus Woesearchaeota archaeon]|jgi:hypothetical protein
MILENKIAQLQRENGTVEFSLTNTTNTNEGLTVVVDKIDDQAYVYLKFYSIMGFHYVPLNESAFNDCFITSQRKNTREGIAIFDIKKNLTNANYSLAGLVDYFDRQYGIIEDAADLGFLSDSHVFDLFGIGKRANRRVVDKYGQIALGWAIVEYCTGELSNLLSEQREMGHSNFYGDIQIIAEHALRKMHRLYSRSLDMHGLLYQDPHFIMEQEKPADYTTWTRKLFGTGILESQTI